MYQVENRSDTASILSSLTGIVREHHVQIDQYLRQMGQEVISDPFQNIASTGYIKIGGSIPDHSIIDLFSGCRIVEFADWATAQNASGVWDRLYSDVIKPLKRRDFQFIFHLGDVTGRRVFEIDEVLDIIGDYAAYGKVTLMLDDREANDIWYKLNGWSPDAPIVSSVFPAAKERYLSLFNTMSIDHLLVLLRSYAVLFFQDGQFDLDGRPPAGIREVMNARGRFSVGYQMGLLLQLGIPHCMALGLVVSEVFTNQPSVPGSTLLLEYMNDWITYL